jgi:hypothetical protein
VTRADWQPGSCAQGARLLGGFLRVRELDAQDCAAHADTLAQLRSGALQAVVLHAVYLPAVLQDVVARLERHDPAFLQTWFPEKFRSWFYGRNVNLSAPGLPGYFAEAAAFHAQLDTLFPAPGLVHRVAGLLAALDGGRPFLAAPGPRAGERYMFTTLRAHLEGGYIPPHVDNEQALRPSFAHLRTLVDRHMMSFVLALTRAGAGGALEVFDYSVAPGQARLMSDDRAARPDTAGLASVSFRLPAGSLIVLDSGRLLHRVSPVEGPAKRWTACSFFALARDHGANYCWG